MTCQAHSVLVKIRRIRCAIRSFPWPRVLSMPGRFVGDPASLARDSIYMYFYVWNTHLYVLNIKQMVLTLNSTKQFTLVFFLFVVSDQGPDRYHIFLRATWLADLSDNLIRLAASFKQRDWPIQTTWLTVSSEMIGRSLCESKSQSELTTECSVRRIIQCC